jgi:hypothetical protein
MLKELRFVQGAVAKKDFLPAMTHFRIEGGHVRSFNGTIALSSPIPFDIDCTPRADTLIKAIAQCGDDTITLGMTPTGRLRVQSGKFKAFVETIDGDTPHILPEGEVINFNGEILLEAIKTVYPFIGNDASRPWTNGVLLRGMSAFATNNVCLVEYWLGVETPIVVNLPKVAIAQVHKNSVTFHYADDRWIRTQLYETNWPDLARVLDQPHNAVPVDERIFEGIEMLKPFADDIGRVYIKDDVMHTHRQDETGSNDMGASFDVEGLGIQGLYQMQILALLQGVAITADFSRYPDHTLFFGERIRGAVAGMKGL